MADTDRTERTGESAHGAHDKEDEVVDEGSLDTSGTAAPSGHDGADHEEVNTVARGLTPSQNDEVDGGDKKKRKLKRPRSSAKGRGKKTAPQGELELPRQGDDEEMAQLDVILALDPTELSDSGFDVYKAALERHYVLEREHDKVQRLRKKQRDKELRALRQRHELDQIHERARSQNDSDMDSADDEDILDRVGKARQELEWLRADRFERRGCDGVDQLKDLDIWQGNRRTTQCNRSSPPQRRG